MKGQILKSGVVVSNGDNNKFYDDLQKVIDIFQKERLYVEIQYQLSMNIQSALLLGREREWIQDFELT